MATMALIQAQVAPDIARRAAEILERAGMSMEEAVQEMLTRTVEEGSLPFVMRGSAPDPEHDQWFRAQVQEALDDPGELISNDDAKARMKKFREELLARQANAA